jgi:dihydrofolate synthase/folylpolyglutamate synthase
VFAPEDPLYERLFPPRPSGVHFGLERVRAALEALGNPHDRVPALHIGGTNGKGSVASTAAAILRATGRRTALYTSPHLCSVTERFRIDDEPIAAEALVRYADEIRDEVVRCELTFFEAMTVLGFHVFAREQADIQVIEVGLGGRLDATNVLTPLACALTNVQRDHAEYLGDTLPAIAREKAGIIKPGVPVLTAEQGDEQLAVFREVAARVGAPLTAIDAQHHLEDLEIAADHTRFVLDSRAWGRLELTTPLVGPHQAVNAALAVALVGALPESLRPSADAVRHGVARVRWPGRDQIERIDGATWLFDVAHNAAGIESLAAVLDRLDLPDPRVAVIGILGDKEWREMLMPLVQRCSRVVLTQPASAPAARRWDPDLAAGIVRDRIEGGEGRAVVEVVADFARALERAAAEAGPGGTVVVTGSCHTVGDALRRLDRVPFASGAG